MESSWNGMDSQSACTYMKKLINKLIYSFFMYIELRLVMYRIIALCGFGKEKNNIFKKIDFV
jgi:hypothetical protein